MFLINVVIVISFIVVIVEIFIFDIIIGNVNGICILNKIWNLVSFIFFVVFIIWVFILFIFVVVFFIIGKSEYKIIIIIVGFVFIFKKGMVKFNSVIFGIVCIILVIFKIGLFNFLI